MAFIMKYWTKTLLMTAAILAASSGCKGVAPSSDIAVSTATLPSISKQFACLPQDAAFIAAHRGTSKKSAYPENSMSGLLALIEKGYLFAEIDVAAISDGTLILYHDDTWDDKSSGTGKIDKTMRAEYGNTFLKNTAGKLTSQISPKLSDVLKAAKNTIYLEIDFKPSAKYEAVISAIRRAELTDQVILISYSSGQASKLARLAPEMMISISAKTDAEIKSYKQAGVKPSNMAVWRGRSGVNSKLLESLRRDGIPILRQAPQRRPKNTAKTASIVVTDYAFDFKPIIGLTRASKLTYRECLDN